VQAGSPRPIAFRPQQRLRLFVAGAYAHLKFIAHVGAAKPLLDKAGIVANGGVAKLGKTADATWFIETCRKVCFWEREATVKQF
jgi:catalase